MRFLKSRRPGMSMLLLLLVSLLPVSCSREDSALMDVLVRLSPGRYEGEQTSEEQIARWQRDVQRFEGVVQEKIDAADQAANLYKLLAGQYEKLMMYGLALENYEEVLRYEPSNFLVLYQAGLAAAQYALSRPEPGEVRRYLDRARAYQERALEIDPGFRDAYFALAVLLLYELEDLEAAAELLPRALSLFPSDTRLLFLYGRLLVLQEQFDRALDVYDEIARISTDPDERRAALANREELSGSP